MMERAGKTADNFEAEGLPEGNRAFVRTHYKLKLHGGEAAFAGPVQRMRAHRTRHAPAGGPGGIRVAGQRSTADVHSSLSQRPRSSVNLTKDRGLAPSLPGSGFVC